MAEAAHGGVTATTEAHGGAAEHHADPTALFLDPTGWVSLAMAVFLLILLVKGVPALIGGMLDRQIAAIRTRLDEAKALRDEAERLRDDYARRIANVEAETRAMVEGARAEADALVVKAQADADALIARRARMAEDKIAAAERQALAEVRATAADAATRAAGAIIAANHGADADKPLVDRTIAGLSRLN
jgi:F-type H+-transporting ATPase subunit b